MKYRNYNIILVCADEDLGTYGDIFTSYDECKAEHPDSNVIFGYFAYPSEGPNDDTPDWFDTIEDAMSWVDSQNRSIPHVWENYDRLFPELKNTHIESLPEDRFREWIDFCFDAYEADGFAKTFGTETTGERKYLGMEFKVIDRVKEITADPENGTEIENLPMWNIKFKDGTTMAAYPEEICLSERKRRKDNA